MPACTLLVDTKGLSDAPSTPDASEAGSLADASPDGPGLTDAAIDVAVEASLDAGPPPAFVETFDAPLDSNKWYSDKGPTFSMAVTSGALHIASQTTGEGYAYAQTKRRYDLRNQSARCQLVAAGTATTTDSSIVWFKLISEASGANAVEIGVTNGKLYAKRFVATVETTTKSIPYVSAPMQWLRIREAAGRTYYEHAAAAAGPYTTFYDEATPVDVSSVALEIGAGAYTNASVGEVVFDNLAGF